MVVNPTFQPYFCEIFITNFVIVHKALSIGRANDCQLECERALRQMREISQHLLPRKPEFLTEVYHYKGLALVRLKNHEAAVSAFQEEYNVATEQYV